MHDITDKKINLVAGLKVQKDLMIKNAELMKAIYPGGQYRELAGAADITRKWIDSIKSEI